MKSKGINLLIVSLLLLGMLGISMIVFVEDAHDEFKQAVQVNEEGVTKETVTVNDLMLNPTEKKEYEILLTCPASGTFDLSLDYEEKKNGGMKPFVRVTITCEDAILFEGTLAELLDGDHAVSVQCELEAEKALALHICYEMPYEVGNEAQGTFADFEIHLTIEKR